MSRKKLLWAWEQLDESTFRVAVFGGWIVKTRLFIEGERGVVMSESMTFVPDSEHHWTIVTDPLPTPSEKPNACPSAILEAVGHV